MNSVLVLKTEITSTSIELVSEYLKNERSKTVAICNANTLVRSYRSSKIQEKINSFDIKAPDGFPVAKASKILYKNDQKRVDGYKVFHETRQRAHDHLQNTEDSFHMHHCLAFSVRKTDTFCYLCFLLAV